MSSQQKPRSSQQNPRCPRCGSRLFQESESRGNRLLYFWECSLGCSRQFELDGKPRVRVVGERRARVTGKLVPAS